MKDVIVSFSSRGRENYNDQLLRLIDSAKEHWHGDMLIYSPDHHLSEYRGVTIHKGWPQPKGLKNFMHSEMPYQFKTSMIQLALEQGYQRIVWLDSSMQLKKNLIPLFEWSGMFFFENLGHPTWKYLSDDALRLLMVREPVLKHIPQVWGGAFGLDLTNELALTFFDRLKEFSVNGSFKDGGSKREGFVAHRHDQAVMSVLYQEITEWFGQLLPYGHILCPPHDKTGEYGTDPFLVCRGL